ncbi:unnamed protein product [Ambrosiozyma monospora]|uniref:Unnamed protein product n=1 Tax=Ambrosiozyma monospora TaxID=43982 RepID=A0ACB5SUG1_AMBMO|nr:unnamed protein product [Ambrosiozyma monospora]
MMAHHYQDDKEEDKPLLKSKDSFNSKKDETPDLINLKDGESNRDVTDNEHPGQLNFDIESGKRDNEEDESYKTWRNRNCKKILAVHLLSFFVVGLVFSLVECHVNSISAKS